MNSKEIGKKLKELRGKRTQAAVADAIGVKQAAYSQYETGERIPSDEVKLRLAAYYKRSVQWLFFAQNTN